MLKKKKSEVMDVVFLLDRSGSMSGLEDDTIDGFNGYLKKMREKNSLITTILFDNEYEMITKRENVSDVKELDEDVYFTRGSTALMDAIGKTIKYMERQKPEKVLFIITTDGYENASMEYSKKYVKKLIQKHKDWEFIYLGADIDSYSEASSIGIRAERTSNFSKSSKGLSNVFCKLFDISDAYETDEEIRNDWKSDLEDYIDETCEL